MFLGIALFGWLLGATALVSLSGSGQITPEILNDPTAIQALITQALMDSPLLGILNGLVSLVATFISMWVAARFLDKRPFRDFGFHFSRTWWRDFGFGLALGGVLMGLIFVVELSAGWITIEGFFRHDTVSFGFAMFQSALMFIAVGFYEEMFSRGYQLRNLAEGLNWKGIGPRAALLISYLITSLFFGFLHILNPNATVTTSLNIALAGLFLGLGYVLTGELAIPIGLHITWNFFQGKVFGFPVSGLASKSSLIAIHQSGPDLWTGGVFGPEGGLIGILAILLGSLLIVAWVRWTKGRARLQEQLAIYPQREPAAQIEPPQAIS